VNGSLRGERRNDSLEAPAQVTFGAARTRHSFQLVATHDRGHDARCVERLCGAESLERLAQHRALAVFVRVHLRGQDGVSARRNDEFVVNCNERRIAERSTLKLSSSRVAK
jgi:hypothetical protein